MDNFFAEKNRYPVHAVMSDWNPQSCWDKACIQRQQCNKSICDFWSYREAKQGNWKQPPLTYTISLFSSHWENRKHKWWIFHKGVSHYVHTSFQLMKCFYMVVVTCHGKLISKGTWTLQQQQPRKTSRLHQPFLLGAAILPLSPLSSPSLLTPIYNSGFTELLAALNIISVLSLKYLVPVQQRF